MQQFPEGQSYPSKNNIDPRDFGGLSLLPLAKGVNHRVLARLRKLMLSAPLTPIVLDKKRER